MSQGFHALINLCDGPNHPNQILLSNTSIISIVNSALTYCNYSTEEIADMADAGIKAFSRKKKKTQATANKVKKQQDSSIEQAEGNVRHKVNDMVSQLLVSMLDGVPPTEVVRAVLSSVNWMNWGKHLRNLQEIQESGYVCPRWVQKDLHDSWDQHHLVFQKIREQVARERDEKNQPNPKQPMERSESQDSAGSASALNAVEAVWNPWNFTEQDFSGERAQPAARTVEQPIPVPMLV